MHVLILGLQDFGVLGFRGFGIEGLGFEGPGSECFIQVFRFRVSLLQGLDPFASSELSTQKRIPMVCVTLLRNQTPPLQGGAPLLY